MACKCRADVMVLWFLQGRVVGGGVDELPPEPEERSGGPQPEHAGVHRNGKNAAGC